MSASHKMTWEEAVQWLREQPDQQALVRDAFYDDPLLGSAMRYEKSSEWSALKEYLPEVKSRALDLGAGRGITSFALAREGWQVTALEPDRSALVGSEAIRSLVRETGLDINVVEEWGEQLPFSDESFDLVNCRAVLHHANDLNRLCKEIGRVLKPGGKLIASREHVISKPSDLEAFFASHPLHGLYGGENAYLLSDYRHAIEDGGLNICKILNPYASDINLFPQTVDDIKKRLSRKVYLPPSLIPDFLVRLAGTFIHTPGRLYTFIARKPDRD